jgi:ribosomal protein S18 acetylase RimI-like enzyme
VRNRRQKKELVEHGLAHGILVYAKGEPVGWCQYGPREELSRIDNKRNYRELSLGTGNENLWRISCFVTDKKHRRRGVASAALAAALESIKSKGGGVVEAYPMIPWEETLPGTRAPMRACSGVWQCVHARNVIHVRKAGI